MARILNIIKYYIYKIGIVPIVVIIAIILSSLFIYLFVFAPSPVIVISNLPSNTLFKLVYNGNVYTSTTGSIKIFKNLLTPNYFVPLAYSYSPNYFITVYYSPLNKVEKINSSREFVNYTLVFSPNHVILANSSREIFGSFSPESGLSINIQPPIPYPQHIYLVNQTEPSYSALPSFNYIVSFSNTTKVYLINTSSFIPSVNTLPQIPIWLTNISQSYSYQILYVTKNEFVTYFYQPYYPVYISTYSFPLSNFTSATFTPSNSLWVSNGTSSIAIFSASNLHTPSYIINYQFSSPIIALYPGPLTVLGNYIFGISKNNVYVFNGLAESVYKVYNFSNITAYSYDSYNNIIGIADYSNGSSIIYSINSSSSSLRKVMSLPFKVEGLFLTPNFAIVSNQTSVLFYENNNLIFKYNIPGVDIII
ncbi:MAG: hypothetical protein QXX36_01740 [Candidatus Rehaiarchaeum fermentans]|nr:hypothetical protein [Candidatus Rehaiarchaeum fermentans]MCW1297486.1 hypothetical protein [Candidatus Rehaiarchaeum fermentans]MCW1302327.1 hypothetical protein [Candidatus Rehaiarchaeum fermentans]